MRRLGMTFIRRNIGQRLHCGKYALKEYVGCGREAVQLLSWSIEGTRSRTGDVAAQASV